MVAQCKVKWLLNTKLNGCKKQSHLSGPNDYLENLIIIPRSFCEA